MYANLLLALSVIIGVLFLIIGVGLQEHRSFLANYKKNRKE